MQAAKLLAAVSLQVEQREKERELQRQRQRKLFADHLKKQQAALQRFERDLAQTAQMDECRERQVLLDK